MRHKGCTAESEIVYYCFHCGKVIDAPEVQELIDAAKAWESKSPEPDKDWDQIIINLEDAVRNLKESEAKNE